MNAVGEKLSKAADILPMIQFSTFCFRHREYYVLPSYYSKIDAAKIIRYRGFRQPLVGGISFKVQVESVVSKSFLRATIVNRRI